MNIKKFYEHLQRRNDSYVSDHLDTPVPPLDVNFGSREERAAASDLLRLVLLDEYESSIHNVEVKGQRTNRTVLVTEFPERLFPSNKEAQDSAQSLFVHAIFYVRGHDLLSEIDVLVQRLVKTVQ